MARAWLDLIRIEKRAQRDANPARAGVKVAKHEFWEERKEVESRVENELSEFEVVITRVFIDLAIIKETMNR